MLFPSDFCPVSKRRSFEVGEITNDDCTPTTKGGQFESIHMFSTKFFKIQEIASQCSKLLDNFSGDFKETEETWTDQLNSLSRWKKMLH